MKIHDTWNEDIAVFSVDWFDFDRDELETFLFVSEDFESCLLEVREYLDKECLDGEIRGIKMIDWAIEKYHDRTEQSE